MGRVTVAGGKPAMEAPSGGIALADIAEGSVVKVNENGSPVEFYVAKHDYESGLNGAGRTLLVRKSYYGSSKFNTAGGEYQFLSHTDIYKALNTTYKSRLDFDVPDTIVGIVGSRTVSAPVFLLSPTELGLTESSSPVGFYAVGSRLPIASAILATMASSDASQAQHEWSRVSSYSTAYIMAMNKQYTTHINATTSCRYRPCFTLPSIALFDAETMLLKGVA